MKRLKTMPTSASWRIVGLLLLLLASSCFKEKDMLLGTPVKITPSGGNPPPNNGDPVQMSYAGPQNFHLNQEVTPLLPTIIGDIIPEVVPNKITTLFGDDVSGSNNGPTPADVRFNAPMGITIDKDDKMYIAEDGSKRVRRILPSGDIRVSIFAGGTSGLTDGLGVAAQFTTILDVAVHPITGDIYAVDANRIRKITPDGDVSTFAGAINNTTGYVDGTPSAARFKYLAAILIDKEGNIYVADRDNFCIRKYTASTGLFTTLAGTGGTATPTAGYTDGIGIDAKFKLPVQLAMDGAGNIYVSDRTNYRIRKVTTDGVVTTVAGDGTNVYKEGNGTAAGFVDPYGIAVTNDGSSIFVGDYAGNRVRKIDANGNVTTVAGDGIAGLTDGVGAAARVAQTSGMTIGANDNLYFLHRRGSLRILTLRGYSISPSLPRGLEFDPFTGKISGTPTETSNQILYTIKAYNGNGEVVAIANLELSVL